MEHTNIQSTPAARRSIWKLVIQTVAIVVMLFGIEFMLFWGTKYTVPNSVSERYSQHVASLQGFFWTTMCGGAALFSAVAAWVTLWRGKRGAVYFNIIMTIALVFGVIAVLFFIYHMPHAFCDAPPGSVCV